MEPILTDNEIRANIKRLTNGSSCSNANNKTMETDNRASRIGNIIKKSIDINYYSEFPVNEDSFTKQV